AALLEADVQHGRVEGAQSCGGIRRRRALRPSERRCGTLAREERQAGFQQRSATVLHESSGRGQDSVNSLSSCTSTWSVSINTFSVPCRCGREPRPARDRCRPAIDSQAPGPTNVLLARASGPTGPVLHVTREL